MLTLHPIAGPELKPIAVRPDRPARVGRLIDCEVCLPHDQVSRQHASLVHRDSGWFIVHASPRSGTHLNGVKLAENRPTPLEAGDLLRIGPWTFRVAIGARGIAGSHAATIDDSVSRTAFVQRPDSRGTTLHATRLRLLIECLGRLAGTTDEQTLARIALESAVAGSGFPRAAILRARGSAEEVELVAAAGDGIGADRAPLSKSLLQQAAAGQTVALAERAAGEYGQSVADLGIHSALCAPVMLGEAVAGFVYLDARGNEHAVRPDVSGAAAFCEAVARAYGLALAEVKRAELARRQSEHAAELALAREIQEQLAPPRAAQLDAYAYAGVCEPGLFVAGDMILALPLEGDRLGICIADAAGHGVAAALLMASTHACLYAELARTGDPAASVTAINRYLANHSAAGRFVSVWAGVLEPTGELTFVDAGHGYAARITSQGTAAALGGIGGPPVGVLPDVEYENARTRLLPGERLVLYTDGMIEQRSPSGEAFGAGRLAETLHGDPDPGETVMRAVRLVRSFAGRDQLDDDASIACVRLLTG